MLQHKPQPDLGITIDLSSIALRADISDVIARAKIAIVLHIYHTYAIIDIIKHLSTICFKYHLILVIPNDSPCSLMNTSGLFADFEPTIIYSQNRGRDIGGKLAGLMHLTNQNYDYVVLAHDKVSDDRWRTNLYDEIFRIDLVEYIINGFISNKAVRLVGGHIRQGYINTLYQNDDYVSYTTFLGKNHNYVRHLANNIFSIPMPATGAYVAGTMFWIDWMYFKAVLTPSRLLRVMDLLEPDFKEPSYAHAMERTFGLLAAYNGGKIGKIPSGYGYPDIAAHYEPRNQ